MARPDPRVGRLFLGSGVRPPSNSTEIAGRDELIKPTAIRRGLKRKTMER
jgi:hypothetical protein